MSNPPPHLRVRGNQRRININSMLRHHHSQLRATLCYPHLQAPHSPTAHPSFLLNSRAHHHHNDRHESVASPRIEAGEIQLTHISTENMIADALTKDLDKIKFTRFRSAMLGYQ
jgi:hypothetical protein